MSATAEVPAHPRAPRPAARAFAVVAASALAGALVLQAVAPAAGGRDLRAGTTVPTLVGLLVSAVAAARLGRRWVGLGRPASVALAAAACVAAFGLAIVMITVGWLAGFYYPGWTVFLAVRGAARSAPPQPIDQR